MYIYFQVTKTVCVCKAILFVRKAMCITESQLYEGLTSFTKVVKETKLSCMICFVKVYTTLFYNNCLRCLTNLYCHVSEPRSSSKRVNVNYQDGDGYDISRLSYIQLNLC